MQERAPCGICASQIFFLSSLLLNDHDAGAPSGIRGVQPALHKFAFLVPSFSITMMQERQVEFVVSSLRYLKHTYKLGTNSSSNGWANSCWGDWGGHLHASAVDENSAVDEKTRRSKVKLPPRCPETHPGLILMGHSFGGVLARAAMVAAAHDKDIGECVCE